MRRPRRGSRRSWDCSWCLATPTASAWGPSSFLDSRWPRFSVSSFWAGNPRRCLLRRPGGGWRWRSDPRTRGWRRATAAGARPTSVPRPWQRRR
uniref:Putative secreted protein n=1 Tax=Ixodes ricinus TaxID=34613 RepID=A0A6B0UCS9_IXORI